MFRHIYFYRLKVGLHDREMVFWTLLFPLVLATLFSMAFANLSSGDVFTAIPVAVVDNQEWRQDESLQAALFSVSQKSPADTEKSLFDLKVMSVAQADQALKDNTIAGYLIAGEQLTIVVDHSGFSQTILKIFTDEYLQMKSAVTRIAGLNPSAMATLPARLEKRLSLIAEKPATTASPDMTLSYFYALIAMTCLYGAFWGIKEVKQIQANQSAEAARVSLAPVHKKRLFLSSLLAALTLHYVSILLLIAYLDIVLKIDFGGKTVLVLLGALTGSLLGVAMGLLIGCLTNRGEGIKNAIVIGISMVSSFLAGLMVVNMKYIVTRSAPVLQWINPAHLISDAFYSLYYYDSNMRFWLSITAQLIMVAVFSVIVVLKLRRQRYASL